MRYTVVLVPDERDGGYVAYVPVIPGCGTQGETAEEAIEMAADAASGLVASMADLGEDLPTEPPGALITTVEVALPELVAAGEQSDGWYVGRTTGHVILRHPTKPGGVAVPNHPSATVKEGTLRGILTQAGLSVEQFRDLL